MEYTIKLFYDGLNIQKYAQHKAITGITTNCSLFSNNSIKNYNEFYQLNKEKIAEKPISFQIWEENTELAIQQINDIYAINPAVYIKIPIINTVGLYNTLLFEHAIKIGASVNITCVYTFDQIDIAYSLFKDYELPVILSIFAGPISDNAVDPTPFIIYALKLFRKNKGVEILWAGCREIYTIKRAQEMGCHIITIPESVMDKLFLNKTLNELSIERVTKFYNDAQNKLSIG